MLMTSYPSASTNDIRRRSRSASARRRVPSVPVITGSQDVPVWERLGSTPSVSREAEMEDKKYNRRRHLENDNQESYFFENDQEVLEVDIADIQKDEEYRDETDVMDPVDEEEKPVFGIMWTPTTGVPYDDEKDPPRNSCFNCWSPHHSRVNCIMPPTQYCRNCGRRDTNLEICVRCGPELEAYRARERLRKKEQKWRNRRTRLEQVSRSRDVVGQRPHAARSPCRPRRSRSREIVGQRYSAARSPRRSRRSRSRDIQRQNAARSPCRPRRSRSREVSAHWPSLAQSSCYSRRSRSREIATQRSNASLSPFRQRRSRSREVAQRHNAARSPCRSRRSRSKEVDARWPRAARSPCRSRRSHSKEVLAYSPHEARSPYQPRRSRSREYEARLLNTLGSSCRSRSRSRETLAQWSNAARSPSSPRNRNASREWESSHLQSPAPQQRPTASYEQYFSQDVQNLECIRDPLITYRPESPTDYRPESPTSSPSALHKYPDIHSQEPKLLPPVKPVIKQEPETDAFEGPRALPSTSDSSEPPKAKNVEIFTSVLKQLEGMAPDQKWAVLLAMGLVENPPSSIHK